MIGFPNLQLVLLYHSLHPKARIFTTGTKHYRSGNKREVVLPHPQGLVALRSPLPSAADTCSLLLSFEGEGARREWQCSTTVITFVVPELPIEVSIRRNVKGKVLAATDMSLDCS